MKRSTPLKSDPAKTRAWQQRSRKPLARNQEVRKRKPKRAKQEAAYSQAHGPFLSRYPFCPVTGEQTTQIHHSAKREGQWLNLQRYWIAVSAEGHEWIESNKREAERHGLMVRINPAETANIHIQSLVNKGISLTDPVFYQNWNGKIILTSYKGVL